MNAESVWDYPRPPKIELFSGHVRIVHDNQNLADSNKPYRILETSHPPTYYIPFEDINMENLIQNSYSTFCEFKGRAGYFDLLTKSSSRIKNVGWFYPSPNRKYSNLINHICFYASKLDECWVNDEKVQPQKGDFYGGWITSNIKGPFKGGPGTFGW